MPQPAGRPSRAHPPHPPPGQVAADQLAAAPHVAQADDGAGPEPEVMQLFARDDRQPTAADGDIEKPGGEIPEAPEGLEHVLNQAWNVLRQPGTTDEMRMDIKKFIDYYIVHGHLDNIHDPYVTEEPDDVPPIDPNAPHDDAAVDNVHMFVIREFIGEVEAHYGRGLHSRIRDINRLLTEFCSKVTFMIGCLTSTVNMLNDTKLLDLLKNLSSIAKNIRAKLYDPDILCAELKAKVKEYTSVDADKDKYRDIIEKLMIHVIERLHLVISVRGKDILDFLDDNKKSLAFIIQVKVAEAVDNLASKTDNGKNKKFLKRFDSHPEFQKSLQEILLSGPNLYERDMKEKEEKKAGLSSLPGDRGAALHDAEGGARPKPGLLIPPKASAETKITVLSDYEIVLRLDDETATKKTAFMLCRNYGLIATVTQKQTPGIFIICYDEKSGAEKAYNALSKEKTIQVDHARLDSSDPLSDLKLYIGESEETIFGDRFSAIAPDGLRRKPTIGQGISGAFGFLEYCSAEQATAARKGLQDEGYMAFKFKIKADEKASEAELLQTKKASESVRPSEPTLYIIKLPADYEHSRWYLRKLMEPFGEIEKIYIAQSLKCDQEGYEFRVGFCTMATFDACDRAIAALNGSPNWGYYQGEPLTVEYAKPRSGR